MPNQRVLFKFGSAAEYAALETKQNNALYFLLDTNELYRGETPFGQAHVYIGTRQAEQTDANAIAAIVGASPVVKGDITVVRNSDGSALAFVYASSTDGWVLIGDTSSNPIAARVTTLEGTVSDLQTALANLQSVAASAFHFQGTTTDLDLISNPSEGDVYQVGDKEYAWNGTDWVELGPFVDLSGYATTADLESLIGHKASSTTDPDTGDLVNVPATGIYAELANNADSIIPLFNGTVSGLVPVAASTLTTAEKAQLFLNATGSWVTVSSSGGQSVYTDPEGNTYNNVEDYVTYMINNYGQYVWESIDEE